MSESSPPKLFSDNSKPSSNSEIEPTIAKEMEHSAESANKKPEIMESSTTSGVLKTGIIDPAPVCEKSSMEAVGGDNEKESVAVAAAAEDAAEVAEHASIASNLENDRVEPEIIDLEKKSQEVMLPEAASSFKIAGDIAIGVINPIPNCEEPSMDDDSTEELRDSDADTNFASSKSQFKEQAILDTNTGDKIMASELEDTSKAPENRDSVVMATAALLKSGLGLLASQYDTDATDDNDSDSGDSSADIMEVPTTDTTYRNKVIEVNSDSDSSDSDVEFIRQVSEPQRLVDVDMLDDDDEDTGNKSRGPIRVKGELLLDDLPPIQDLKITVPENECVELGKIHSIVDQLVLVDSIPGTVPLNLDTVLFLDKGQKVLGEVFDVLGQIATPLYCVRFNSNKQIKERGIEIGQTVYIAPRSEHTQFVILPDMLKIRGSDASWENDVEPSDKHLDYSDDEEERSARRSHRNRDRGGEETDPSKRQRPTTPQTPNQQQHQPQQQNRHSNRPSNRPQRPYYQRAPRYREAGGYNHQNYHPRHQHQQQPQFPPPFNYGAANGSWHTNYNQPPPQNYYPAAPFQRMPFVPSEVMQQALFPPPPPPQ